MDVADGDVVRFEGERVWTGVRHGAEMYYWNTVTNEVTWEPPGDRVFKQVIPTEDKERAAPAGRRPRGDGAAAAGGEHRQDRSHSPPPAAAAVTTDTELRPAGVDPRDDIGSGAHAGAGVGAGVGAGLGVSAAAPPPLSLAGVALDDSMLPPLHECASSSSLARFAPEAASRRLRQVLLHCLPYLQPEEVVRSVFGVCVATASISKSVSVWRLLCQRLAANPSSGGCCLPATHPEVSAWRGEFFQMLSACCKWSNRKAVRPAFKVSVHVRLRPEATDSGPVFKRGKAAAPPLPATLLAEDMENVADVRPRTSSGKPAPPPPVPRKGVLLKRPAGTGRRQRRPLTAPPPPSPAEAGTLSSRIRRVTSVQRRQAEADARATAAKAKAGRPVCPWDRAPPRFSSREEEARKALAEKAAAKALAAAPPPYALVGGPALWQDGSVCVAAAGAGDRMFSFPEAVWWDKHSQGDVFRGVATPLIRSTLLGYNCTLFMYGQTGSGKTYTMFGPPFAFAGTPMASVDAHPEWGLLPRCVHALLTALKADVGVSWTLSASCVEVYNEGLFDILANRNAVRLVDDDATALHTAHTADVPVRPKGAPKGFSLSGQASMRLKRMSDVVELTRTIEATRVAACTSMLTITQRHIRTDQVMQSRLLLVDLAGSERVKKSKSEGRKRVEAVHINQSLTCLGRCIACLARGDSHTPYRDSVLTCLLSQSLGGSSRTAMVVTCRSHKHHLSETFNSLRFGERTATVQNKLTAGAAGSLERVVRDITARLRAAREELMRLEREGHGEYMSPAYATAAARRDAIRDALQAATLAAGAARHETEARYQAAAARQAELAAALQQQEALLRQWRRARVDRLKRVVYRPATDLYVVTRNTVDRLATQLGQMVG